MPNTRYVVVPLGVPTGDVPADLQQALTEVLDGQDFTIGPNLDPEVPDGAVVTCKTIHTRASALQATIFATITGAGYVGSRGGIYTEAGYGDIADGEMPA